MLSLAVGFFVAGDSACSPCNADLGPGYLKIQKLLFHNIWKLLWRLSTWIHKWMEVQEIERKSKCNNNSKCQMCLSVRTGMNVTLTRMHQLPATKYWGTYGAVRIVLVSFRATHVVGQAAAIVTNKLWTTWVWPCKSNSVNKERNYTKYFSEKFKSRNKTISEQSISKQQNITDYIMLKLIKGRKQ